LALLDILSFGLGIALLVGGAWSLISGGTRAATVLAVPPVVVGLTVVAFGTSAPELFVSIIGAMKGSTGLVLGNVIGSNVANLGLILGLTALVSPVCVEVGLERKDYPVMLAVSLLFAALAWDGVLGRLDAMVLMVVAVVYIVMRLRQRDRSPVVVIPDPLETIDPDADKTRELFLGSALVVLGVAGLAGGGGLIVGAATRIALQVGVSETIVGLTMVAIGTSLPEMATTIVAAARGEHDLAMGNIVGSNLFNILLVAGPVAGRWPLAFENGPQKNGVAFLPSFLNLSEGQVQLVCSVLLGLLVMTLIQFSKRRIGRKSGLLLLGVYALIMFIWTV